MKVIRAVSTRSGVRPNSGGRRNSMRGRRFDIASTRGNTCGAAAPSQLGMSAEAVDDAYASPEEEVVATAILAIPLFAQRQQPRRPPEKTTRNRLSR